MRIVMCAALAAALLSMAGCSTTSPEDLHLADTQACSGYGFSPGTDEYAKCMFQLDQDRANRRAADALAYDQQMAAEANRPLAQPQQIVQPTYSFGGAQAQQPVTCKSSPFGGEVKTTCQNGYMF